MDVRGRLAECQALTIFVPEIVEPTMLRRRWTVVEVPEADHGAPIGIGGVRTACAALVAGCAALFSLAALEPAAPAVRAPVEHRGPPSNESIVGVAVDLDGLLRRANHLSAKSAVVVDSLVRAIARFSSVPSIMPVSGTLSSRFSLHRLHPVDSVVVPHYGIDVVSPAGTRVVAPAAGQVTFVGRKPGYGRVIEIDHGNAIVTRFGHCSRTFVRAGQWVVRGQPIAEVGSTGRSTGPHLHYEVRVDGMPVDPLDYALPERASAEDRIAQP